MSLDNHDAEVIAKALSYIPADARDDWLRMAFAVKNALGDAGFDIWGAWSRTNGGDYNERVARVTWRSAKAHGGVTIGSLYALAREHGWTGTRDGLPKPRQGPDPRAERERERRRLEQEAAARRGEQMLRDARPAPHPYLEAKGFPEHQGLVLGDSLLVPMRDHRTGQLLSVQTIDPQGGKKFVRHGRASGAVYRMGRGSMKWYCEGYCTGLSVMAALQEMHRRADEVVVCFSAQNMLKVAQPGGRVVADHDMWTCPNADCRLRFDAEWRPDACPTCGAHKLTAPAGEQVARRTGLPWWQPPEVGDANDLHNERGLEALVAALRTLLSRGIVGAGDEGDLR